MFEVRVHDIDRLRVARAQVGQPPAWSPFPWFSSVNAVAGLPDGTVAVGGAAGLTRLSADLRRCLGRDDSEALRDLQRGVLGLLGAGERHVCLWPNLDRPARRIEPAAVGLFGAPVRVRWHPDQRRAAIVDERGQIVVISVQRSGEVQPEAIVGDVPHVDGVTWHPSGRTLVIAGADDKGARLWSWSAEDGLAPIALPRVAKDACAVAFHPRTHAMHVVYGRQRLAQGGWGEPLVPLGELSTWPTDGRLLEFTGDSVLLGTAGDGLHIWDRGAHTWYHPGISLRIHCDDPCFCIAGDRLLLGTQEGLLVSTALNNVARPSRDGAEMFSFGVPRLADIEGPVDLAPDASAVALASGTDRVTVWSLERPERPVTVRTWGLVGVRHEWLPSAARLQILFGDKSLEEWTRLDRGEGDRGTLHAPPDDPPPPPEQPAHGWQLAALEPGRCVLRDPDGQLHPHDLPDLPQLLGAAWARSGDLVILGASAPSA